MSFSINGADQPEDSILNSQRRAKDGSESDNSDDYLFGSEGKLAYRLSPGMTSNRVFGFGA